MEWIHGTDAALVLHLHDRLSLDELKGHIARATSSVGTDRNRHKAKARRRFDRRFTRFDKRCFRDEQSARIARNRRDRRDLRDSHVGRRNFDPSGLIYD